MYENYRTKTGNGFDEDDSSQCSEKFPNLFQS